MSDDPEPAADEQQLTIPPSHDRILVILACLAIAGTIVGMTLASFRFGLGIFAGSFLAFVNYYWLKRSLKIIFAAAAEGEKPRMLAGNYFLRYIILGAVIAIIYAGDLLPIVPVILGMGGFGFAVIVEAFIRVFAGIFSRPEPPA